MIINSLAIQFLKQFQKQKSHPCCVGGFEASFQQQPYMMYFMLPTGSYIVLIWAVRVGWFSLHTTISAFLPFSRSRVMFFQSFPVLAKGGWIRKHLSQSNVWLFGSLPQHVLKFCKVNEAFCKHQESLENSPPKEWKAEWESRLVKHSLYKDFFEFVYSLD